MTNDRLEQIKQIRAYGLQAEPTALLLAIDDLLAGAAVSASPQPDFKGAVTSILANCAARYANPRLVHALDPQSVIDKQIDNGVEILKRFFAAAPAQEPDYNLAYLILGEALNLNPEYYGLVEMAQVAADRLTGKYDSLAAQEQPVESSPQKGKP